MFRRSKSVKPRGEGPTFTAKLRARMAGALEQSGGLWMPQIFPESTLARALAAVPTDGFRALLAIGAEKPMTSAAIAAPLVIALGPEGGLEEEETAQFVESGFTPVRIGGNVLRFETAALAALAVGRTLLSRPSDE
jgi:16S rRNA (uracil1498-N3)-methyltransferase